MKEWRDAAIKKVMAMSDNVREIRETAANDLFFFAQLVNPGYMYGEVHKECFKWIQDYSLYRDEDGITNKLLMLPRAHLKSHMVATWAAWIIVRHPEVTILYVSATAELAERQLFAIKNILTRKEFVRYFPEYIHPSENKREKWTNDAITIDHPAREAEGIRDNTISTAGLTTNTTGWHADILIPDDLVVPENAYTEQGRNLVASKASQFTSILNPGGFTLACGTRYHPKDIYSVWKDQKYETYDDEGEVTGYVPVWEIKEEVVETDGVFLWERVMRSSDKKLFGFDNKTLARIRAQYNNKAHFYAQYYNNPNDDSTNRISRDRFQYYDKQHLRVEGGIWYFKDKRLNVYAAIDFAFSIGIKSDSTAIVVIGIDSDGFIYVLDIASFKTDKISGYFNAIKSLHSKWDFNKLRAEVTVAQSIIVRDLKDTMRKEGLRISIDSFRPMGNKEERIAAALDFRYENQTIWHFKGGLIDVLEEELVLNNPPHDDIKDALASAVDIAIKPKQKREREGYQKPKVSYSRFGGVAFK